MWVDFFFFFLGGGGGGGGGGRGQKEYLGPPSKIMRGAAPLPPPPVPAPLNKKGHDSYL